MGSLLLQCLAVNWLGFLCILVTFIPYTVTAKSRRAQKASPHYTNVRVRMDSLRCCLGCVPGHTMLLLSSFRSLTRARQGLPSACRAAATSACPREQHVKKSRRGQGSCLRILPSFGDQQFPEPRLQRQNPKWSPSSSKSLLR